MKHCLGSAQRVFSSFLELGKCQLPSSAAWVAFPLRSPCSCSGCQDLWVEFQSSLPPINVHFGSRYKQEGQRDVRCVLLLDVSNSGCSKNLKNHN